MGKGSVDRLAVICVVALAIAFSAGCSRADALLSVTQFRERVAAEIKRQHPDADIELVSPVVIGVTLPGQHQAEAFVGDAYGIYRMHPDRLDELVRDSAGLIGNGPERASAKSLVVLVQPAEVTQGFGREERLVRPIAGDLVAVVVYDTPAKWVYAPAAELRSQLGMDDETIWRTATANTRVRAGITPQPLRPNEPVDVITGVEVASSLIADDEFWQMPELTAQGPVVVAALQQDEIYIVPLTAKGIVDKLRQVMKADDPRPFSRTLLLRRNGRWEVLR
jgi:hypothetical protein